MAAFEDHFSGHAASYSASRPDYPDALFSGLAKACATTDRALDVATGSGQAAAALARHFNEVIATDASAEQVRHARPHPRVRYVVARAEECPVPDASCDLVTVAQAMHWFDHPRFFAEVQRIVRPGGVFAAWTYALFTVEPRVEELILDFYSGEIDPYWPPERRHIENGYADIPVPGEPVALDPVRMTLEWTADDALAYLDTWSATRRFAAATGVDPVARIASDLRAAWGEGRRLVEWPLTVVARRL